MILSSLMWKKEGMKNALFEDGVEAFVYLFVSFIYFLLLQKKLSLGFGKMQISLNLKQLTS